MTTLTVPGMNCEGCEETVVNALKVRGRYGRERRARHRDRRGRPDGDALVAAVNEAGYEASR